MIISEEDVDTDLETAKLLVKVIKDRKLVQEALDQVLKVVRCHYTEEFQREALHEAGVIKNPRDGVKILGNGELTKKLTVKVNAFSEGAKAKIEAAGGTCEVI